MVNPETFCRDDLKKLLMHGDEFYFDRGQFGYDLHDGRPFPPEYQPAIVREMARFFEFPIYQCVEVSTGNAKPPYGGFVRLTLADVLTGETLETFFNIHANYLSGKKKGSPLPKHRFNLTPGLHFTKLWQNTPLEVPQNRLAGICRSKGKLRGLYFTGTVDTKKPSRLVASSVKPFSLGGDKFLRHWLDVVRAEIVNARVNQQSTNSQHRVNEQSTLTVNSESSDPSSYAVCSAYWVGD